MVPGLALNRLGEPRYPSLPSLIVEVPNMVVEIDHCIVGGLRIASDAERVQVSNSIVDATADSNVAYSGLGSNAAGAPLRIENPYYAQETKEKAVQDESAARPLRIKNPHVDSEPPG